MIKHNGKAVTDIKVIQNKAQVDVNKAVWNGVTVWQRVKDLAGHTTVTINPTSYSERSDEYYYSYSGKSPSVTSVVFNDGSGAVPLTTNDYSVSYTGDSGTISHYDTESSDFLEGTKSVSAAVTITGQGSYTGSVNQAYSISHTYKKTRQHLYVYTQLVKGGEWKKIPESATVVSDAYISYYDIIDRKLQLHIPTSAETATGLYDRTEWISELHVPITSGTWTVTPKGGFAVRGWSEYSDKTPTKGLNEPTYKETTPGTINVYVTADDWP